MKYLGISTKSLMGAMIISCLLLHPITHAQSTPKKDYAMRINQWHNEREKDLKMPSGWLNLEGLFWLHKGVNTLGAAKGNDCKYENLNSLDTSFPSHIGNFIFDGDSVLWENLNQYQVKINNMLLPLGKKACIFNGESLNLEMTWSHYSWTIIKRADKIGVRFRNLQSLNVTLFKGIDRFPVNEQWKIKAVLHPPLQTELMILNVLGQNLATKNAGKLSFTYQNKQYNLDVIDEGSQTLFITFADATSDVTTYGAGRFIDIAKPDANGNTEIDFNKAYNPPCAFTQFATCPLPPPQNRLPLAINAGEKIYGRH